MEIMNNCGRHGNGRHKSYGGRQLTYNKYPWVATIEVEENGRWEMKCSGALISPRHVITAAHCFKEFFGPKRRRVDRKNQKRRVFLGSRCNPPQGCEKPYSVKEVIHYPCLIKERDDDIAIMHLEEEVSSNNATPICLPGLSLEPKSSLLFVGAGYDSSVPEKPFSRGLQELKLKYKYDDRQQRYIVVHGDNTSTCDGDSGGPLFQQDSYGRWTIMGTLSHGDHAESPMKDCTTTSHGDSIDYFTDVRPYLGWICRITGVCAFHPPFPNLLGPLWSHRLVKRSLC